MWDMVRAIIIFNLFIIIWQVPQVADDHSEGASHLIWGLLFLPI